MVCGCVLQRGEGVVGFVDLLNKLCYDHIPLDHSVHYTKAAYDRTTSVCIIVPMHCVKRDVIIEELGYHVGITNIAEKILIWYVPGFNHGPLANTGQYLFCYIGDPDVISKLCYDHIPLDTVHRYNNAYGSSPIIAAFV